jgi:hypothetical protein
MWTFSQATGDFGKDNVCVGVGYSGAGPGRNNPKLQFVRNVGPIPRGHYKIGPPHDTATHGPYVMVLTPLPGTHTHGRAGFLIHGDNRRHDASHGCIILDRLLRHRVWLSGDHQIRVTL